MPTIRKRKEAPYLFFPNQFPAELERLDFCPVLISLNGIPHPYYILLIILYFLPKIGKKRDGFGRTKYKLEKNLELEMTKKTYKPGEKAPVSAQYGIIGPRGGEIDIEITGVKGKTLPPTEKPGQKYVIKDRTNNDSGKGG